MKTVLSRSSLIGFIALVIVAMLIVAIGTFYGVAEPGQKDLLAWVYMAWFPISMMSPVGLPALVLIVALVTWQLTGNLTTAADIKEKKKQLMIAVWTSTSLATVPFLLLTVALFVGSLTTTPKDGGDASGLGMAMFFSMMCLFWNLFLIFSIGLIARLFIRNELAEQHPSLGRG